MVPQCVPLCQDSLAAYMHDDGLGDRGAGPHDGACSYGSWQATVTCTALINIDNHTQACGAQKAVDAVVGPLLMPLGQ